MGRAGLCILLVGIYRLLVKPALGIRPYNNTSKISRFVGAGHPNFNHQIAELQNPSPPLADTQKPVS